MKKLLFASLFTASLICFTSLSAKAPAQAKQVTLKLTEQEVRVVLHSIAEQKMNDVANLYFKIQAQLDEQLKDTTKKK